MTDEPSSDNADNTDDMPTERFQLRVSKNFLKRVDEWRRKQPDLPTRSEAIRRIVEKEVRSPS